MVDLKKVCKAGNTGVLLAPVAVSIAIITVGYQAVKAPLKKFIEHCEIFCHLFVTFGALM